MATKGLTNTLSVRERRGKNYIEGIPSLNTKDVRDLLLQDRQEIAVLSIPVESIVKVDFAKSSKSTFHATVVYYGNQLNELEKMGGKQSLVRLCGSQFLDSQEDEGSVYVTTEGELLFSDFVEERAIEFFESGPKEIDDEAILASLQLMHENGNALVVIEEEVFLAWKSTQSVLAQILGRAYLPEYWENGLKGKVKFWLYLFRVFPKHKEILSGISLNKQDWSVIKDYV